ncbi:creatininase [Sulfitobacter alexandrii]|uniref:Creatininase n=1 Tax=Sulfitobacter alexandrii TaxID=1917485 RepID=A0A1J0WII4_9RHOB|nr:creatininase family protein [Sulfitobacter alexandrii]APE44123.1 creatininase [Sulfitobacter alexandrii]
MTGVQGYWADLSAPLFRDLPQDVVAVLPCGATEQHGPHLPLRVDADLAEAVAARALTALLPEQNVLILPPLTITRSVEHDAHPGTLSLTAETLLAVLRDIGASVARAGVARLVLLNAHGGNTAVLEIAARDMRIAHDMIVAHASWFAFADAAPSFDPDALRHDLHAGEIETSAMLAARPDLVDMTRAADFGTAMAGWEETFPDIGLSSQPARPAWVIDDIATDGACGNAAAATAEKGEALLQSAGRNFAAFLADFARFDHRATKGVAR